MTALLYQNARTIGFWLQLFAFSAYLVYLQRCVTILRRKQHEGGVSLWLPAVCVLIFVITVMIVVINMVLAYRALSVSDSFKQPNPTLVYAEVASALSVAKNAATVALALISDIIMVYRTYIVWNMNTIAILAPVGLLLADIALGIWSTWSLSQTSTGSDPIMAGVAIPVRDFFAITFALNILCAGMICWKIWRVHSRIPPQIFSMGHNPTAHVFEVMIQTAALYCAHLLILVVSDRAGSNVFFLFLDPLPPVTALVFTVLIVRARAHQEDKPPTSILTSLNFLPPPPGSARPRSLSLLQSRGGEVETDLQSVALPKMAPCDLHPASAPPEVEGPEERRRKPRTLDSEC
ncbi:hypothetical protein C8Q80DRAFT_1204244 [Daedaleopsis nitida]|nr:hypothetical protein C8Q80DRAFT_1204244 [Daedaleopsis nitida]